MSLTPRKMEVRKLVKSGNSSIVVSLPKSWIEKNRLKQGDNVFIDEEKSGLTIKKEHKQKEPEKKEKIINVDGKSERVISREIVSGYINNYHYVIFRGKTLNGKSQMIKKYISELIALEVVDDSSERIVARNFLNIYDTELDVVLRRMDNIVRSMMIDMIAAIDNPGIIGNLVDRDKEVNKLNFLISKILKAAHSDPDIARATNIDESQLLKYWEINIAVEKIGDRIKHMAESIGSVQKTNQKPLRELLQELLEFYKNAMKSFYTNSIKDADEVSEAKFIIGDKINEFASHKCVACAQIAINAFNLNGHINDISRIVRYVANDE